MACSTTLRGRKGEREGDQDKEMERWIFHRTLENSDQVYIRVEVLWLLPVLCYGFVSRVRWMYTVMTYRFPSAQSFSLAKTQQPGLNCASV